MRQEPRLAAFAKALTTAIYGTTPPDCCVECKQPFDPSNTRSARAWAETKLSGLCEDCWDKFFGTEGGL